MTLIALSRGQTYFSVPGRQERFTPRDVLVKTADLRRQFLADPHLAAELAAKLTGDWNTRIPDWLPEFEPMVGAGLVRERSLPVRRSSEWPNDPTDRAYRDILLVAESLADDFLKEYALGRRTNLAPASPTPPGAFVP